MSARAQQLLLELADDELIVGWRDSEWTGIAPTLEEDVAFSSIAQNEIGHARALYELAAVELGTDADALAFDRAAGRVPLRAARRAAPARTGRTTIARRYLYEEADRVRLDALHAVATTPSSRGSRRRSTARRSTTGCTPSCGRRACATSRASRRRSRSCGRTRSGSSSPSCGPSSRAASGLEPVARRTSAARTRPSSPSCWEQMTEVRRIDARGAQW